ncbi:hypothetical protein NE237_021538 [Protea cynaroides]|uniref:Pentatricopeptide repeat-containing protein n=1 Tax=Protea cynaroides TaxID=273540 RepID=A0A9Q0HBD8_9MAGN|nr:hypothetical protein NE237_021538 [Protea cynaroides]
MKSLKEGLIRHTCIIKSGLFPPVFTSNQLIHLYSQHGFLVDARQLFDTLPERNVFTWNAIIYAYIKNKDLSEARALFNSAPHKDSITYNSMISGYASSNDLETAHARQLFYEMQQRGIQIVEFTLTTMLNATTNLLVPSDGEQLQAYMVKTANDLNQFAVSALIDMYSKCGCFEEAYRAFHVSAVSNLVSKNAMVAACCREGRMEMALDLFWRVPEINDIVSWNTLISGYVQNNNGEEALKLLVHMGKNGIRWSEHTFTSVLSACSSLKSLKHGREIHACVLKSSLSSNPFISSSIVDMYSKCDNIHYAELVHTAFGEENAFSTTSLIVGHSSQGNMVKARRLFDSLAEKNSVCEPVFELLREFLVKEKYVPDALILVSVICACAIQAALDPGKQIHAYTLRMLLEIEEKLSSALIDMYAKFPSRDRVVYNAMIAGYAHHGFENDAIQLFEEMLKKDIRPDRITFIALLSACRHAGLVEAGDKYFVSMTEDYSLSPEIDHYSCMIDLYGRANKLDKAMALMREIPIKLDAVIWGAFLNACRINGNVGLAKEAEEEVLRIEADNAARYVQLANTYAAEGNWIEMGRIRRKMRGREVKKLAGCSWIYVGNIFTSGDRSHREAKAIYTTLVNLTARLNEGNTYVLIEI